jgi:outer membrane protein OmpA-like peptidoglycan-associated protein/flagellar hook assembly protein FlgD
MTAKTAKTGILIFAASALLFLVLAQGCAKKELKEVTLPQGKTAEIIFVVGDVFVSRSGDDWVKAQVGDILREGSRIRTEGDSYCEITISSGTIFRMKDRSELQLVQLPESKRENKSLIRLEAGSLFAKVSRLVYRSEDTLETPTVILAVRGTEFMVGTEKRPVEPSPVEGAGGDRAGGDQAPAKGAAEVLVAKGVVNVRLNIPQASFGSVPGALKPVLGEIERGLKVRGGHKLEVPAAKVDAILKSLEEAAARPELDETGVEALKQEIVLEAVKLTPEDRERLRELEGMAVTFVRGDTVHVSPNFDGVNDEFVLDTARLDLGRVRGWKLVVLDGRARVVKTIAGNGEGLVRLPAQITWNLVGDNGQLLPDGSYVYELFSVERGNRERIRLRGILEVDTRPPELAITPQDMTFSPDGDGVKDIIAFTIQAEPDADWSCAVTSDDGIVVKSIDWGKDVPVVFEWDGRGESGNVLPDGLYDFSVTGTDRAGNKTVKTVIEIALDTRSRGATVVVDRGVFSPNRDGVLEMVTFFPFLTDLNRIDTWDLVIQTEKGETMRRFRGQGSPPLRVVWDGAPEKGKGFEYLPEELPSAKYLYFLKVVYRSGVNTFSFKKELLLDRDPPRIALSVSPELFSPDGDGENDALFIVPTVSDLTPITAWKAVIYTAQGTVFKIFSGIGLPADAIAWDGVSDRGIRVSSAEDFVIQFDATDSGANTGRSDKVPFSVDILVIPTERGLKIQVSNIEFAFDTADLKGERTFAILKRIIAVLEKYRKYSITIEGHTDSTGDPAYNVELSRRRAQSVGKYLVKNGIVQDRLSYEGYGSKYPVDTNDTPEGRAKNRRVEFLLQKR